jgi:hypothetical protein
MGLIALRSKAAKACDLVTRCLGPRLCQPPFTSTHRTIPVSVIGVKRERGLQQQCELARGFGVGAGHGLQLLVSQTKRSDGCNHAIGIGRLQRKGALTRATKLKGLPVNREPFAEFFPASDGRGYSLTFGRGRQQSRLSPFCQYVIDHRVSRQHVRLFLREPLGHDSTKR